MEKDASLQGKLVVFVVGQTDLNLESTSVFESKTLKHSPAYPDVIPKQKIIKLEKSNFLGRDVTFLVKAYLPDIVIVEATVQLENLLSEHLSPPEKRDPAGVPEIPGAI